MKLLMGYDTKKTLSENKKNFIFEAGESTKSFPTSALGSDGKPKYSTDEIIQVYKNNKIKSPDGKFTYYAPSNIVITKLLYLKVRKIGLVEMGVKSPVQRDNYLVLNYFKNF